MGFYSRCHYQRLSNGAPDTPETIAERVAYRKAAELAHADALAKFQTITPENAAAAIAYQEERIRFHKRELLGQ